MGIIRKTASISTLGLVNFRSKKEKLTRAERALQAEHLAREVAERGLSNVGTELRRLSDAEAKAAKQLARLRRRSRRVRKAERLSVLAGAQPLMHDVAAKSRQHGRKARKAAGKAAHEVRVGAENAMEQARSALSS